MSERGWVQTPEYLSKAYPEMQAIMPSMQVKSPVLLKKWELGSQLPF